MSELRFADHGEVPPIADENSRVLLLGSMLSPKSAEARFYYAHPQNRFWSVIAAVFGSEPAADSASREALARANGIALWDVLARCEINGAADSTIKNAVYNDIDGLLAAFPRITHIYTTGGKAHELLKKYAAHSAFDAVKTAVRLPSTSPLNCAAKLPELIEAYSVILRHIR